LKSPFFFITRTELVSSFWRVKCLINWSSRELMLQVCSMWLHTQRCTV